MADTKSKRILLEITKRQAELHQLQGAHAELCLALVERPDDPELQGQLNHIEHEQADREKAIVRLRAAHTQAQIVDSGQVAEIEAKRRKAAASEAIRLAGERVKVAQMLDGVIATLAESLRTIHELDEKIYLAARDAGADMLRVRGSSGVERYGEPLAAALESTGLSARLSGIQVSALGVSWVKHTCKEKALLSQDRLRNLLGGNGHA